MILDLENRLANQAGVLYENTYGMYLEIFEQVATHPPEDEVIVRGSPWSWLPFFWYLRCKTCAPRFYFSEDYIANKIIAMFRRDEFQQDRKLLEMIAILRPELVDVFWKIDVQWKSKRRVIFHSTVEAVTNHSAFHREEYLEYLGTLHSYTPSEQKVVIVPCAADKPYPSPLHQDILKFLPDDWYLCVATGVLGLIPQDLWDEAPIYDSGLPNRWRTQQEVTKYFSRNRHTDIVVYVDFLSQAVANGLDLIDPNLKRGTYIHFVNPVMFYADYLDLRASHHLEKLKEELV